MFKMGQKVRIKKTGEVRSIASGLMSGKYYRLDNGFLYEENELEAIVGG